MNDHGRVTGFVGIYDADATLLGEVSYWIGARLGTRHCSLCDLTHGLFSVKSEWKECTRTLSVPVETYHRNDAPAEVLAATAGTFPMVLARTDSGLVPVLGPDDLEGFHGDTTRFVARLAELAGRRD